MNKNKTLVLDVDGTLCYSGEPISDEMGRALVNCLKKTNVCILTSRRFPQIEARILKRLICATKEEISHLHLFLAQGTQYYCYLPQNGHWKAIQEITISSEQVNKIYQTIETAARKLDLWHPEELSNGDKYFENAGTQVTFSGVGCVKGCYDSKKRIWDPSGLKRELIIDEAKKISPEFHYQLGGATSIDITLGGLDKYFGMTQIMKILKITKKDIIYLCDEVNEGGNDYPVVSSGDFECRAVSNPKETLIYLQGFCDS